MANHSSATVLITLTNLNCALVFLQDLVGTLRTLLVIVICS